MRIMMMHKTEPKWEAGVLPSPEFIAEMGKLMEALSKSGLLLAGEGLRASSLGMRLKFSGGKRTVTPGPFIGSNELITGMLIVRVASMDEAVEWASRFANVVGDVEIDIRPVTEPWDIGMCPKPAGELTTRFMMTPKADQRYEAGIALTADQRSKIKALIDEMTTAGILLTAESLQPSSRGMRLKYSGGKRMLTDGPFTESKELIAGFVLLEVPSPQVALEWSSRFADLVGDVEIDVRPLYEAADFR
jgi:hypothetical protein